MPIVIILAQANFISYLVNRLRVNLGICSQGILVSTVHITSPNQWSLFRWELWREAAPAQVGPQRRQFLAGVSTQVLRFRDPET